MSELHAPAYRGVVLGVDPKRIDPASLEVAIRLGEAIGSCELVTVVPVGTATEPARARLMEAATQHGLAGSDCQIVERDDAATYLLDRSGDDRLLVIGCGASHPLWLPSPGDVGRSVLRDARHPVLVVGPAAAPAFGSEVSLVVCVSSSRPVPQAVIAVNRWIQSFGVAETWVAGVVATSTDVRGDGARAVHAWADAMCRRDLLTHERVLHGGDPVEWLEDFVADVPSAVYVVSSERYTDGRRHLHSTTRELIRRSRHPVLVVPARDAGGQPVMAGRDHEQELTKE